MKGWQIVLLMFVVIGRLYLATRIMNVAEKFLTGLFQAFFVELHGQEATMKQIAPSVKRIQARLSIEKIVQTSYCHRGFLAKRYGTACELAVRLTNERRGPGHKATRNATCVRLHNYPGQRHM